MVSVAAFCVTVLVPDTFTVRAASVVTFVGIINPLFAFVFGPYVNVVEAVVDRFVFAPVPFMVNPFKFKVNAPPPFSDNSPEVSVNWLVIVSGLVAKFTPAPLLICRL